MKRNKERGSVILESTYCIIICIFVWAMLLSLGFLLYQKTVLNITANEIAEEVSLSYKYREIESPTFFFEDSDIESIGKYRYLLFEASFNRANNKKGKKLAEKQLALTALSKKEGNLSVNVETVADDIGRRHYEVTVSQKYSFLLGDFLALIGMDETQTLTKTVYVESFDVLNYVNTVKMTQYGLEKLEGLDQTGITDLMNGMLGLINTLLDE